MKTNKKLAIGILIGLMMIVGVLGIINRMGMPKIEENIIEIILLDQTIIKGDLETFNLEKFEGTMKRKVGEPTVHSFEGVELKMFLIENRIDIENINEVVLISEDNYEVILKKEEVLDEKNAYLARVMDGEALMNIEGKEKAPMLVLTKGQASNRWAKYIKQIQIR